MTTTLEKIAERLDAIAAEQIRQGAILAEHQRRSTNLEARVIPLEDHVSRWAGAGKLLTLVLGILSAFAAVWKTFR